MYLDVRERALRLKGGTHTCLEGEFPTSSEPMSEAKESDLRKRHEDQEKQRGEHYNVRGKIWAIERVV